MGSGRRSSGRISGVGVESYRLRNRTARIIRIRAIAASVNGERRGFSGDDDHFRAVRATITITVINMTRRATICPRLSPGGELAIRYA
jgi:hypothetical protein